MGLVPSAQLLLWKESSDPCASTLKSLSTGRVMGGVADTESLQAKVKQNQNTNPELRDFRQHESSLNIPSMFLLSEIHMPVSSEIFFKGKMLKKMSFFLFCINYIDVGTNSFFLVCKSKTCHKLTVIALWKVATYGELFYDNYVLSIE